MRIILINVLVLFLSVIGGKTQIDGGCNQLTISDEELVCICNSTYCDTVPKLDRPSGKSYQLYSTSKTKLGFTKTTGAFQQTATDKDPQIRLEINRSIKHQKIVGFGGSFSDSTGYNILSLPEGARQRLLESYFGPDGVEYSLGRVPIGGADFSLRQYSYDDNHYNDTNLDYFSLQKDDYLYKIPMIKKARDLLGSKTLRLVSSAWSAPAWMKTNNKLFGTGRLKREFYQTWADYHLKFFRAYRENGVDFWGTTTQNEPTNGLYPYDLFPVNCMGWTPSEMNQWIGYNLGPTLRNSEFKDIKIMVFDDSSYMLPSLPQLLENDLTLKYVDGVAIHWYSDNFTPKEFLMFTKSDRKDLFLINTEACNGFLSYFGLDSVIILGSWKRGAAYIDSIFNYLEFGAVGWIDWNMVLDKNGGPSYSVNAVDAPVIVDDDRFFKQPMFYAIGHFSKFIVPDSIRVDLKSTGSVSGVRSLAFLRPDNSTVVTIYNENADAVDTEIQDGPTTIRVNISPNSINTVIY